MARDHARIMVSIWGDDDFKALRAPQQHAFFVLLSQPRLSYCGVVDYLPGRFAALSKGMTAASVETTVEGLEKASYVVVDADTQELLVRSFVRHDGLLQSPNVTKAMAKDYGQIISPRIRAAVLAELQRARRDEPDLAGWKAIKDKFPMLWEAITNPAPDPYENPSRNPYANPSEEGSGNPSENPSPDPW
ncbi:MAG TPA: hypothetical protein VGL05_19330 [Kribbella sp.]